MKNVYCVVPGDYFLAWNYEKKNLVFLQTTPTNYIKEKVKNRISLLLIDYKAYSLSPTSQELL